MADVDWRELRALLARLATGFRPGADDAAAVRLLRDRGLLDGDHELTELGKQVLEDE